MSDRQALYLFAFSLICSFFLTSCTTLKTDTKVRLHPAEIPLNIYQKYISPVDGARCRMYPSCSSYSKQAFAKHGFLKGWIMTCDRLLRCGRNEHRVSAPIEVNGMLYCNDSVANNDFWWYKKNEQGDL